MPLTRANDHEKVAIGCRYSEPRKPLDADELFTQTLIMGKGIRVDEKRTNRTFHVVSVLLVVAALAVWRFS